LLFNATFSNISAITIMVKTGFVNYKEECTRHATASDKVYQLLAHGRWFSPGTPASSTSKTGHHDIAEIVLKVALNTNQNQSNSYSNTHKNVFHSYIGQSKSIA
jgi:hypothetical protein